MESANPSVVDRTDWLKLAAIVFISVDHFGYFFVIDAGWWNAVGRLAAPIFFFLMGFAETRTIPIRWIVLGLILTGLDGLNNEWTDMAPNILLSFALIRWARTGVQGLLQRYQWVAFVGLLTLLFAVVPISGSWVDYGAEGWLWALFGLCQRMAIDDRLRGGSLQSGGEVLLIMPIVAALVAAGIYVWQEQLEFQFSAVQFASLAAGIGLLAYTLSRFRRGASAFQPPTPVAGFVRFVGRRSLEIYAVQLAGFELLVLMVPDLAA
jgi:hypothetical protein